MTQNAIVLSEEDAAILQRIIDKVKRDTPPARQLVEEIGDYLTPEVYLAKAPVPGGLPGATGTSVGKADCQLYRVTVGGLEPLGLSKEVWNPGPAVPAGTPTLVERDKYGTWLCVPYESPPVAELLDAAKVSRTVTLTVPDGQAYFIPCFDRVNYDGRGYLYSSSAGEGRLTPPDMSVVYLLTASVTWAGNATGRRHVTIYSVSDGVLAGDAREGAPLGGALAGDETMQSLCWVGMLSKPAWVSLVVAQTSGADLDLLKAELTMTRLGNFPGGSALVSTCVSGTAGATTTTTQGVTTTTLAATTTAGATTTASATTTVAPTTTTTQGVTTTTLAATTTTQGATTTTLPPAAAGNVTGHVIKDGTSWAGAAMTCTGWAGGATGTTTANTDASGNYTFNGLGMGTWRVNVQTLPTGYTSTPSYLDATLASNGQTVANQDFDVEPTPPAPAVTGINPANGNHSTSTSVTITGSGFTGVTGVTFGGQNAASYTVNSGTSITAMTGTFATSGSKAVQVLTTHGNSNATVTYGAM